MLPSVIISADGFLIPKLLYGKCRQRPLPVKDDSELIIDVYFVSFDGHVRKFYVNLKSKTNQTFSELEELEDRDGSGNRKLIRIEYLSTRLHNKSVHKFTCSRKEKRHPFVPDITSALALLKDVILYLRQIIIG